MTTAAFQQQLLAYFPHTDTTGDTWQKIANGTATSNGASNGTTVIDTSADSGGADTYNGRYWVQILSGDCIRQWKRIVDDNGSGTLTVEGDGFTAQIASGVSYAIWLSPDPVVVVESSSGETNMVDAVRNEEANDFWIGWYAVPITGSHRGKIAAVTDYVKSSGTFTLAASFGSALTAGDVVLLRRFIDTKGEPSDGLTEEFLPRSQMRSNNSIGDGTIGPRGGTFGFTTQARASGSLAASGSIANESVIGGLLRASGLVETIDTSSTVGSGSTTTAIAVATGSWENHSIGGAVIHNGNLRRITALTDGGGGVDTVTVSPALPVAPTASDVLYAVRRYAKAAISSGERAVGFDWHVDGQRTTITGCKGNVTFQGESELDCAFEFSVDHWVEELEREPYNAGTSYSTAAAVLMTNRQCWLGTTATDMGGITFTPATAVSPNMVQGSYGINGRAGFTVTDRTQARASYRRLRDRDGGTMAGEEAWWKRTSNALLAVFGSHGDTIALAIPVSRLVEFPRKANDAGKQAFPNVVAAHDAGVTNDGGSTSRKVPDWAVFIS